METYTWRTQRIICCLISIVFAVVAFLLLFVGNGRLARAEPIAPADQTVQVQTKTAEISAATQSIAVTNSASESQPAAVSANSSADGSAAEVTDSLGQKDLQEVNQAPQDSAEVDASMQAATQASEVKATEATTAVKQDATVTENTKVQATEATAKPTVLKQADSKIAATMAAAKQATAENVVVTNEQQLNDALGAAPSDGTVQTIVLGNSFATAKGIFIKQGQNITFINQGDAVQLNIGQRIDVAKGGAVTFKGTQKDGITIVPADTFGHDQSALNVSGKADLTNTTIKDFTIEPTLPSFYDGAVTVGGGTLVMNENAYITGNHLKVPTNSGTMGGGGISITDAGTVILNENSYVTGNAADWGIQDTAGGISVHNGSHLIINGGHVDGNAGPDAGGIFVGDVNETTNEYPASTMVMNGGTIDENISWTHSGGLFVDGAADVTINGGSISRNKTGLIGSQPNRTASGGGIAVNQGYAGQPGKTAEDYNQSNIAKLTINDAVIDGNHAAAAGGGIYVNSNNVTINKATITNNIADIHGGGIYVSIAEYTLRLGNSLITENEAVDGITSGTPGAELLPGSGGGIWFCPTGSAMIYVTDGTAIFGNTAVNHGADILSEAKSGSEQVTLANRMLGGGGAKWFHDRDGEQETTPVTVQNNTGYIGLKNVTTDAAKAVAASLATVLIKGNKAPRGGGIGANGSVIFGANVAGKAIKVNKLWELGSTAKKPESVKINLVLNDPNSQQNGGIVDTIELNEANNWTAEFADLPTNIQYQVTEDKLNGFTSTNSELKDLGNGVFEITFTNKAIEKPVDPVNPVDPINPVTPVTPDQPKVPDKPVTPPDQPVIPQQPVTPVQPTETQTVDKVEPKALTQTKLVDNKVEAPIKLSEATQPVAKRDVSNTPKASGISEATDLQQAQLPQTGDKQSVTPILLGLLLMIVSFGGMALGKKRHGLK